MHVFLLVSISYYFKPLEELSPEEQAVQKEQARKLRHEAYDKALDQYKVAQEEATKLRDIKKCMYGDHIMSVPHFHLQMFRDSPLPESSARYVDEKALSKASAPFHVPGQHLVGTMIPIPVDEALAIEAKKKEEEMRGSGPTTVSSFLKKFIGSSNDSELTVPLTKKEEVSYGGTD